MEPRICSSGGERDTTVRHSCDLTHVWRFLENIGPNRNSSQCFWFMCMSFPIYWRDVNPFETDTKGRLFVVGVSKNWPSNRNGLTKVLDSWTATQLNLLRQKSVNLKKVRPWDTLACCWDVKQPIKKTFKINASESALTVNLNLFGDWGC